MRILRRGLTILVLFLCAVQAGAIEEQLILNLWTELEPMIIEGDEHPVSFDTAAKRMLEQARIFFSGMIYGYRFTYTPSDISRGVADRFELLPVAEIVWGDPRLVILYTEKRDNRIFAKISYSMQNFMSERRKSWNSNTIPLSSGQGEESLFKGQAARMDAYREAIKQAVREHARKRYYNKPRELSGDLLLWEEPYTIIKSGTYTTRVTVKLTIHTHTPYLIF